MKNNLKKYQNQLIKDFIKNPKQMEAIMNQYRNWNEAVETAKFHKYSISNLILANHQLHLRTGHGIELLAPYKRWNKVNRYVKKGEKAVYILAPISKKIEEATENEAEYITWFKKVPVFDLSQTDGEPILNDNVKGISNMSFNELLQKIDCEVLFENKTFTKGWTDGEKIVISSNCSDNEKIAVLFHELAHMKLHYKGNEEINRATKELEAETVGFLCCSALGLTNEESGAYITNWYKENAGETIKNSNHLLKCAEDILKSVGVF